MADYDYDVVSSTIRQAVHDGARTEAEVHQRTSIPFEHICQALPFLMASGSICYGRGYTLEPYDPS
jgi:hypothetical protein